MYLPYIILALGYALLASTFMWVSISVKGKWALKFALAPLLFWFGLYLYFIPPQLSGYPSDDEIKQKQVIVRFFASHPPTSTSKGVIYVVVDTRFFKDEKTKTWVDRVNPATYSDLSEHEFLRLYRIPWDEELVQDMNDAQQQKKLIILNKNSSKKKRNGKEGEGDGEDGEGNEGSGRKKGRKGRPGGDKESDGEGGTGGTARYNSDDETPMYSVEALTPNQVFRKSDD